MTNTVDQYIRTLSDPMADKTDWTMPPLTKLQALRMPNTKTYLEPRNSQPHQIMLKTSRTKFMLAFFWNLILTYIVFMLFTLASLEAQINISNVLLLAYVWILFFFILYQLLYGLKRGIAITFSPAFFDTHENIFKSGRRKIDFNDIHAIQILYGHDLRGPLKVPMRVEIARTYLVLKDSSRIPVCTDTDIIHSRKIAHEIASITKRRLWDPMLSS